jgi:xanthine dehydrogenase YagS FAD-binding subunit
MKNFTYYRPTSVKQAVGLLDTQWGKTELLAGGTDLLDLQKQYVAQPEKVVSLRGVQLSGVQMPGATNLAAGQKGTVAIGAATTLEEIADAALVRNAFPALVAAASVIGGPQIRNMGTLGGNLCQRNRCWYFRDEHVKCLLKGGSKCFALDGENQYHAVFTQGHKCVIVHPSTLAPVLIALEATAQVEGPNGNRNLPMSKFFHPPSSASEREHVLQPNEIVTRVLIPQWENGKNASYQVNHKESHDWPVMQAAVAYKDDNGKTKDVKIVLGQVAPTPHVADAAAKSIEGKEVNEETATAAGKAAVEGAKPLAKNGYKVALLEVAVKRALLLAAGKKPYWEE